MHELSVISSIIDLVKSEMDKIDNLKIVKEVHLEVGDLTFLGHDQLKFGFRTMTESEPKINPQGLIITSIQAVVKCRKCGHEGGLETDNSDEYHISTPIFACPQCEGRIDIVKGKECLVKNLIIEVEDD